jgi:hypothetical protein
VLPLVLVLVLLQLLVLAIEVPVNVNTTDATLRPVNVVPRRTNTFTCSTQFIYAQFTRHRSFVTHSLSC